MKNKDVQKTLFDDELLEYYGLNAFGEVILIPNFQPLEHDDNPRLDMENPKTKRKNRNGR